MTERDMTYSRSASILKAPCPHGLYDRHEHRVFPVDRHVNFSIEQCPGGSLLPPDSLVIVKEDGDWPEWVEPALEKATSFDSWSAVTLLNALAAAQPEVNDAG